MTSRSVRAAALSACLLGSLSQAGAQVVTLPISVPLAPAAAGAVATAALPALSGPAAVAGLLGPQLALPMPGLPAVFPVPQAAVSLAAAPLAPAAAAAGSLAAAARPLESLAAGHDGGPAFDGARRAPAEQLELPFPKVARKTPEVRENGLPTFLSIADARHGQALAEMMRVASQSKTARRVFAQADQMAQKRGRPITVVFTGLRANNGEYVYDWDMLRMGAHYLNKEPIEAAATLVHELLHVVQKAQVLPVDAAELELEAYMVTFEVMRELGILFEKGSFYKSAYQKFRAGSVPDFIRWMVTEYKGNIPLLTSRISAYVKVLKARQAKAKLQLVRWDQKLHKERAAVAEMVRTGQDPKAIEDYQADVLGKLETGRRDEQAALDWIERDLAMLSTPDGRARYRAYAKRVYAYMRAVHSRYVGS